VVVLIRVLQRFVRRCRSVFEVRHVEGCTSLLLLCYCFLLLWLTFELTRSILLRFVVVYKVGHDGRLTNCQLSGNVLDYRVDWGLFYRYQRL